MSKYIILFISFIFLLISCKSEKEIKDEENYQKFKSNSLSTGSEPYYYLFGNNLDCSDLDCSIIKIETDENSDVIVSIKKQDNVIAHAYIRANDYYSFNLPNGVYQIFFYYGKGWDPNKTNIVNDNKLIGGFLDAESFGKDENVIFLEDNILTYKLYSQVGGNFNTTESNINEAF